MRGVFKGWKKWGDKDENGNYYVDKNGVPSKQEQCNEEPECTVGGVPCAPEWEEWSQWSCQGSCPENSVKKRHRVCRDSNTQTPLDLEECVDTFNEEAEEIGEKCLKVDFDEPFVEPITRTELQESGEHGDAISCVLCIDEQVCSDGRTAGWANFDYVLGTGKWAVMHFNTGEMCHFPSFGKGWPEQTMSNGDQVQMGVECENDWNYDSHSIAKEGETCNLVCKNKSDSGNVYKPVTNIYSSFKCRSPIPIFAFQEKKCNKNLMPNENDVYDDCYNDWVENGLNMGSSSPYETDRDA